MDLTDLKALAVVAEEGSVNKACATLGISRTTLRRRLGSLERELGTTLLTHDEKGVRVTRAGGAVLARLPQLLRAVEELNQVAQTARGEPAGPVRVVVPIGLPLAPQVQALLAQRRTLPRIQVVVTEVSDPMAHLDDPFELLFHFGPPPARGTWFSRSLLRVPLRLFAARSYLEEHGAPADAGALCDHPVLEWRVPGLVAGEWPLRAGGSVPIDPWCCSPNVMFLGALAAEGGGLLLAPEDLPAKEGFAASLVPVLGPRVGTELPFRVLSPDRTEADPAAREVLRVVQSILAALPVD